MGSLLSNPPTACPADRGSCHNFDLTRTMIHLHKSTHQSALKLHCRAQKNAVMRLHQLFFNPTAGLQQQLPCAYIQLRFSSLTQYTRGASASMLSCFLRCLFMAKVAALDRKLSHVLPGELGQKKRRLEQLEKDAAETHRSREVHQQPTAR